VTDGCIPTGRRAGFCRPGNAGSAAGGEWDDLLRWDDVIMEYMFLQVATDGIVVNPAVASDPGIPCRCTTIDKRDGTRADLCFKRGVVGTLTQEQAAEMCRTREALRHPEGFRAHIQAFQRASDECAAGGAKTVEGRVSCMGRKLREAAAARA